MSRYYEHNREKDTFGNTDCPWCGISFLHKSLANCDKIKRNYKKELDTLRKEIAELKAELQHCKEEFCTKSEMYSELVLAVENKHNGETRHETALKYIKQAEISINLSKEPPTQENN